MPNLVKCLRDVEEGCRAVLFVIEDVVDSADETMSLFNCGVPRSKAGLSGLKDEDNFGDFPLSWKVTVEQYSIE
jgi:hypothetical protein